MQKIDPIIQSEIFYETGNPAAVIGYMLASFLGAVVGFVVGLIV